MTQLSGDTPEPGSEAEAEGRRAIGKGPFSVDKPTVLLPQATDVVEVVDAAGNTFAVVFVEDCAGGDVTAAKARATRIAEALNR